MKKCYRQSNEGRSTLHTIQRRKANWVGHILCRNCLLKYVIEGKIEGMIEVTGRRRSRKQLRKTDYELNECLLNRKHMSAFCFFLSRNRF